MAKVISALLPKILGLAFPGGSFLTAIIGILGSLALGAISKALFGPPKLKLPSAGVTTTQRSSNDPRRLVYGVRRMSGVVVFVTSADPGGGDIISDLYMALALAQGPVKKLDDFYFNELQATDERFTVDGTPMYSITAYLGSTTQTAHAPFIAAVPSEWTSAHRLRGIAYLAINLHWQNDPIVWPTSIPNVTCMVHGRECYDPRDGNVRFIRNPAIILRDYLVDPDFGLGVDEDQIDDDSVSAAANICAEMVTLATRSVTVSSVSSSDDTITLPNNLMALGLADRVQLTSTGTVPGGTVSATNYYWIPYTGQDPNKTTVGKLATSVTNANIGTAINLTSAGTGTITLTRNAQQRYCCDAVISLDASPGDVIEQMVASMAGRFVYSQGKYRIAAGAAEVASGSLTVSNLRAEMKVNTRPARRDLFNAVRGTIPDAARFFQDQTFPPIINATYEAEDGGVRIYNDLNLPYVTNSVRAQRIAKILLERSRQGITIEAPCNFSMLRYAVGDVLEVTDAALGFADKEFQIMEWTLSAQGVDLTLQEYAASAFDWDAGDATEIDPAPDTNLPSPWTTVRAPSLNVTDDYLVTAGTVITRLLLEINETDPFTLRFDIQYRLSGTGAWTEIGTNQRAIPGVVDGETYEVRARTVSRLGKQSAWTTQSRQVVGSSAPPGNVSGFSVNIIGGVASLSWNPVIADDLSHYRTRYAPSITETDFGNATDLVTRVGRQATTINVPARVGTYFIVAVDLKGHESAVPAYASTDTAGLGGLSLLSTLTEDPTFAGTKVNTTVVSGDLQLASDGAGGVVLSGTYEFAGPDHGSVGVRRVVPELTVSGANISSMFDSTAGLFDSAIGAFDGTVPTDVNISLEIATTTTALGSPSPIWTAWRPLPAAADFSMRAAKFRATLTSAASTRTPILQTLTVKIYA